MSYPTEHPIAVVLRAVRARLTAAPEVWGARVYEGLAPLGTPRPLVIMAVQDAREINDVRRPDALITLSVKVVATPLAAALEGAQRIAALLNDAGDQDSSSALTSGDVWRITTVTLERTIHINEMIDGQSVHHAAAVLRFRLAIR